MISAHRKITVSLLAGSVFWLFTLFTPATAPAAPTLGTCSPTQLKYSVSTLDLSSTSSEAFVNVPETTVSFNLGSASCVIVRFSAMTQAGAGNHVAVRAFLDNAAAAIPPQVLYSGDDSGAPDGAARARAYEFVFPNVASGSHILRMQFKSGNGTVVKVHRHTTVIQYAP